MNCKPGDLAIQIKSLCGNEGKIVTVIEFIGEDGGVQNCWLVENYIPVMTVNCGLQKIGIVPDAWLRPVSGLPMTQEDIANEFWQETTKAPA